MSETTTLTPTFELRLMSAQEFLDEAVMLLVEHREELATDKAKMILNPDHGAYLALDEQGKLLVIGAYRSGVLIGYSASIITHNLHYSDLLVCQNDVLFLTKGERKGAAGLKLIRETQRLAKQAGCEMVLWHAKPDTNLDAIMPRLGARVQDIIWKVDL